MRKPYFYILLAIALLGLAAIAAYFVPPIHSRVAWRLDDMILKVRYQLNPPEEVVFVPQGVLVALKPPVVRTTPHPTQPASTPTASGPTPTPPPTPTSTLPPTPLPERVSLVGVRYEDQHGRNNYCAPANLAMALSYWGWQGDRDVVGPVLKPDPKDKNVMPYEMVDYVLRHTNLRARERVGGDLQTLKRFIAAGYPVLVEKAAYFRDISGVVSWLGHYQVVTGYDDAKEVFIAQDSFTRPDYEVPYADMETYWRGFNNIYILIYPPEAEAEILALLGSDADEQANFQRAAEKAAQEIVTQTGIDLFYAWYNRGTNLVRLKDYAGAAQAYDSAYGVYPSIPTADRPWRMVWYQTGPYFAYFNTGRYGEVINLADTTLKAIQSEKNLEETYIWRARAKAALGDLTGAIEDYQTSLKYHPGFEAAIAELEKLGAPVP